MAFMQVYSTHETMFLVEDSDGSSRYVPTNCLTSEDNAGEPLTGWFARLSANGYLDCTSYEGPFATEAEAVKAVCALYDCDENGDDVVE